MERLVPPAKPMAPGCRRSERDAPGSRSRGATGIAGGSEVNDVSSSDEQKAAAEVAAALERLTDRQRRLYELWSDKSNWRGNAFLPYYYSREDRRVVVPRTKRWAGWTLNFAHRLAWLTMLASAIVAVGPALLALWLLGNESSYTLPVVLVCLAVSLRVLVRSARYLSNNEI